MTELTFDSNVIASCHVQLMSNAEGAKIPLCRRHARSVVFEKMRNRNFFFFFLFFNETTLGRQNGLRHLGKSVSQNKCNETSPYGKLT